MKWTPGPWVGGGIYVSAPSGYAVAVVDSNETAPRERRKTAPPLVVAYANARLIAAAPELYAALRMLAAVEGYEQDHAGDCASRHMGECTCGTFEREVAHEQAHAALAKADGQEGL